MASILVTGGAGFIGSNLCRALLNDGHIVHAVDNLVTGHVSNISSLLSNEAFSFHEVDIVSPLFPSLFEHTQFDMVYHLACPTGVPNIRKLGEEMIHTCSLGTLQTLQIAAHHGAQFLFTSSAEIYGEPEQSPQAEHYSGNVHPLGERSAYEEGKRFSETCVMMYVRKHNLNARIVRLFNTYGPGMSLSDTRVVPQFLSSIINGSPLRVYGDGSQTRCHLYVDDLVHGLRVVMENGSQGEAYNIGSDEPMTVRDLADLMISLTHHKAGVVFEPHFIQDHSHRRPSTEKIRALGWSKTIHIKDGLRRMIDLHVTPRLEQTDDSREQEQVNTAAPTAV